MNHLNKRIYNELDDWKYAQVILNESLLKEVKIRKYLNAFLIFVTICSIVGWFNFENLKFLWSIILIFATSIRILQNVILPNDSELFSIKSSIAFYNYNIIDLENLFYDYHSSKYKDSTIENRFNKLRNDERNLFSKQTFDKIKDNKQLIEIAENKTDKYLIKLKNQLSNE